jgi:hypothetical protein
MKTTSIRPAIRTPVILLTALLLSAAGAFASANETTAQSQPSSQPSSISQLEQAGQQLWQAAKHYAARQYDGAKQYLQSAAGWLRRAGDQAGEETHDSLQALARDSRALADRMPGEKGDFAAELAALEHRIGALFERESDRLQAHWQQLNPDQTTLALIEAKMHLGLAEGNQLVTAQSDAAGIELERAAAYLDVAAAQNDETISPALAGLRNSVGELKKLLAAARTEHSRTLYQETENSLEQLIRQRERSKHS